MRAEQKSDKGEAHGDHSRERGLALLVVLWIIVSAILLVTTFNATVRSSATFVASEVQLAKTEAVLDAGAEIAAVHLIDAVKARRWPADGSSRKVTFGDANLTISILDANGLIDLNKTDDKILLAFFRQFAGSEAKAAQLRDGVMSAREDVEAGKDKSGAQGSMEDESTVTANKVPDAIAFVDASQIRGLGGMTPELYKQIAPYLTVYSASGRINPITAPSAVLGAIPQLTRRDAERLRDAPKAGRERDSAEVSDIKKRAGDYLSDRSGPAFLVTVEASRASDAYLARKVFVIATGLDRDAPYRLVAKKPMTLSN
jgi:general secretion pathway protein K